MEQKYDNSNRGALWSNKDKKRPEKRDPDFQGYVNACCPHCKQDNEFQLSAWKNERTSERQPVLSLSVREGSKEQAPQQASQPTSAPTPVADVNDEIPF